MQERPSASTSLIACGVVSGYSAPFSMVSKRRPVPSISGSCGRLSGVISVNLWVSFIAHPFSTGEGGLASQRERAFHPDRKGGKVRPDRADLPVEYQPLVDWYDEAYSKQPANSLPSLTVSHRFPADANSDPPAIADFDELRSHTEFVGPGGTVVLPKYLQEVLRLKEGSCLSIYRDNDRIILLPITDEYISKMRGSLKGDYSLQHDREREHRIEKER